MEKRVFNCDFFSTSDYRVVLSAVDMKNLSLSTAHNDVFIVKRNFYRQWKWLIVNIYDYRHKLCERYN